MIQNIAGRSPLVSCFEEDCSNYDSLEVLLNDHWDPNHLLQDNQIKYKDHRKSVLFFAVRNNDDDCVDLLLQFGAKVDQDPLKVINLPILMGNFDIFNSLLDHGGDIHEVNNDVGMFPTTMASGLSDHRFIKKLCQLGLDISVLFQCPYGENAHPTYEEAMQTEGEKCIPWCLYISKSKNKQMGDWLMPYLAKFTNYKFKLCSQLTATLSGNAQFQIELLQNSIPTLKHQTRLKGMLRLNFVIMSPQGENYVSLSVFRKQ